MRVDRHVTIVPARWFLFACLLIAISATTSCIHSSKDGDASDFPIVVPAFKSTNAKKAKPILKVFEVSGGVNPVFISGNKRVAINEQNDWRQKIVYKFDRPNFFTVIIDNQQAMKTFFVGHVTAMKNYGHPFDPNNKGVLTYDEKNQTITFKKKYTYATGKTAFYTHTLRLLENGNIKVKWDLGIDAKTLASFKRNRFYFVPTLFIDQIYRKTGIDYNA